ncbi:MAG: porin family protein [bacterium]|nr:porin family protein [bacterium]
MKRLLTVVLVNFLLAGMPAMAQAEQPAHADWNQFYFGISGGVLDADTMIVGLDGSSVFGDEAVIADLSGIAGLYGLQAGATAQFGSAVVGIEMDFSGSTYDNTLHFNDTLNATTPDFFTSAQLNWLSTLRAKAGLAYGNSLAYVTGGFAFADVDFCATDDIIGCRGTSTNEVRGSEVFTGFTVGSGVEFKLTDALSVKAEYLYVDLDRKIFTNDGLGTDPNTISLDMNLHVFRAGLNYSFGHNGLSASPQRTAGMAEDGPFVYANWNSFYVGFSGGVLGSDTKIVDVDDSLFDDQGRLADLSGIAGIYGVQAGLMRQFGSAVIGLEADISRSNYDESLAFDSLANPDHFASAQLNWLSTLRAKAGLAYGNSLIYVTGGLAFADVDFCASDDGNGCLGTTHSEVSGSEVFTGFTVGSGVEFKLTDALSVKTEYLYVDLDRETFLNSVTPERISVDMNMHVFRAGLNYSFGHSSDHRLVRDEPEFTADWNDFYVGVSGGVAGNNARIVDLNSGVFNEGGASADLSSIAGTYGVQAGLNWQMGSVVLGLEADFSGTNYDEGYGFDNITPDNDFFASAKMNWLSTLRAKAGLAYGNTLVYVTGGLAFADVDFCATRDDGATSCRGTSAHEVKGDAILAGFAAGTGVEFKISDALSIKTEYLFVGLDNEKFTNDDPGTDADSISLDTDIHLFRVGLNYSFGPLPAVE